MDWADPIVFLVVGAALVGAAVKGAVGAVFGRRKRAQIPWAFRPHRASKVLHSGRSAFDPVKKD